MTAGNACRYRLVETEWGFFAVVAADDALLATFLPESERAVRLRLRERYPQARQDAALLPGFVRQVRDYFRGRAVHFDVRLALDGVPPFHRDVYEQCRRIPFGHTASYQDLARAAGSERAVRAVGNAMAHNRLPLVVPCHRVVRTDGSIGGFSSPEGINQKERLLRLEGLEMRDGCVTLVRPCVDAAVA